MATKAELLAEVRQPPAVPVPQPPEHVLSHTIPWPLPSPSSEADTSPILKKRHSTYIRPIERATTPVPELPPHRPPRNPARTSSVFSEATSSRTPKSKPRSRPSTATGATGTPEAPSQLSHDPTRHGGRSLAPSVKSKASSIGLATGPIEDVTPWELFPAPVPLPSQNVVTSNVLIASTPSAPPPGSLHPTKATGLAEDVTPWELEPLSTANQSNGTTDPPPLPAPMLTSSRSQPASLLSEPGGPSHRLSTATGPTEEVTPWELETAPENPIPKKESISAFRQRNSLTMTKAQVEEVMPWELYPAPPVPAVKGGSSSSKTELHSTRASTSSSKTRGDFTLIRRHRSTGSRPSKPHSNSHPTLPNDRPGVPPQNNVDGREEATTPTTAKSMSPAAASPGIWQATHGSAPNREGEGHHQSLSSKPQGTNNKFSTADRTILEELKRNIHARNAHFVMKGVAVHLTDGGISLGKKHHAFISQDVPYPRSYEREVIDLDVWETLFCQDICESLTWHVFEEPPARVLDLGCGTGTWILNCARQWRETQFTGLDIVPLHPDLQQVGSADLASRITWVQANFLDGLPFPNDEFDFVHVKRIALGVPEDKWDTLFDEISRVMKPGGALEMVEEDLFFPGKPVDQNNDDTDIGSVLSRSSSLASIGGRREVPAAIPEIDGVEEVQDVKHLQLKESSSLATPTMNTIFTQPSLRPPSPGGKEQPGDDDKYEIKSDAGTTTPPGSPKGYITLIPPHSRSTARPVLYVKTNQSGHAFAHTSPPKQSIFGSSAVSLLGSLTHSDPDHQSHLFRRRRSSSNLTSSHTSTLSAQGPSHPPAPIPEPPKILPFLLRTPAKAPVNPRDHSLLEYIYNEMLSARFINSAPLSLLTTYLEYHFKDARSHPPLLFTFPPQPVKQPVELGTPTDDEQEGFAFSSKGHKPRNSPITSTSRKSPSPSSRGAFSDENGELDEEHRWLSMQGLLQHSSPYVSLDVDRRYVFPPSTKSSSTASKAGGRTSRTRMPNKTLNIDLRTLNLHLALRAKEVLACSETMWEWIRETQLAAQDTIVRKHPNGRGASFDVTQGNQHRANTSSGPDHRQTVLEMNREDFNQLLLNFEMDMQDQASVNTALRERFQWTVIDGPPSVGRKIFETACEKYEKWLQKEGKLMLSSSTRPSHSSPHKLNPSNAVFPSSDATIVPQKPARKRSNSQTVSVNRPPSGSTLDRTNGIHDQHSTAQARSDPLVHFALPTLSTELGPTQKLCRAMGVFVAWKPPSKFAKS